MFFFHFMFTFFSLKGCISATLQESMLKTSESLIKGASRSVDGANHSLLKEEGISDLMRQCARGDLVEVKRLLESGADLNEKNENGHTPIMFAAEYGNLATTALFV